MACGLRSSDMSNLVSWLQVSVLEAEPTAHNGHGSPWARGGGKVWGTIDVAGSSIGDRLKAPRQGENGKQ